MSQELIKQILLCIFILGGLFAAFFSGKATVFKLYKDDLNYYKNTIVELSILLTCFLVIIARYIFVGELKPLTIILDGSICIALIIKLIRTITLYVKLKHGGNE